MPKSDINDPRRLNQSLASIAYHLSGNSRVAFFIGFHDLTMTECYEVATIQRIEAGGKSYYRFKFDDHYLTQSELPDDTLIL